ncbi:hypothetical protein [Microbulbifer yueqingensis]|uniref:Uncharacterized protein n=1 Tax=Microbulbifer yueqingensis TaxID=658219 RepID=A0A1G9DDC0_9GAMM|nr:hypothetical protein [Microbulbifer yueqingensis]SDK61876.1 hypothetical protein SAMN05216212_2744 [Microbulbifer yueqingensis]
MPSYSSPYAALSEVEIRRLRQQLEEEIAWLNCQLEAGHEEDGAPDLALAQTYREMIFSRRALLGRLPR